MSISVVLVVRPAQATASTPVSNQTLGINVTGSPSDLATASAAGIGLARYQVISGSNIDAVIALTAAAHLRLYPMLGLPKSQGPTADAAAMATFVTSFAQRYGPGGSFWTQHPELPYLPVLSYEIGNEPDVTPSEPADSTSLHYAAPASYAQVYEAARTALHLVDPSAQAVVGGILDSGAIPLAEGERYLSAVGPMDAVGYHPYLYDATKMENDTLALRKWLDANGHTGVPLDINEFGAATGLTAGIATWGAATAAYTQWALCTPALHVENVQPFWWGAIPLAATDMWFPMVNSQLSETALGSAYLHETSLLTSQGCPSPPPPVPAVTATKPATTTKQVPPAVKAIAKQPTTHRGTSRSITSARSVRRHRASHPSQSRHPRSTPRPRGRIARRQR